MQPPAESLQCEPVPQVSWHNVNKHTVPQSGRQQIQSFIIHAAALIQLPQSPRNARCVQRQSSTSLRMHAPKFPRCIATLFVASRSPVPHPELGMLALAKHTSARLQRCIEQLLLPLLLLTPTHQHNTSAMQAGAGQQQQCLRSAALQPADCCSHRPLGPCREFVVLNIAREPARQMARQTSAGECLHTDCCHPYSLAKTGGSLQLQQATDAHYMRPTVPTFSRS
jgi:hypothetical protein